MKALNHLKGNSGFTLIELLISVCIMAIAFAGLATMQIACINGNTIASNLTTGITLAQDMMEELNGLDFNDTALNDSDPANNTNLRGVANFDHRQKHVNSLGATDESDSAPPGFMYTRYWNIADDTPVSGRKTVVVIVAWKGHMVSVSSIIGAPFS